MKAIQLESLADYFAYLAANKGALPLVRVIFGSAVAVENRKGGLVVRFPGRRVLTAHPPTAQDLRGWPDEIRRLARKHEYLTFPDDGGWGLSLGPSGLEFDVEGLEDAQVALEDYSDAWIYRGEKLAHVSHEDGAVGRASKQSAALLFLTKVATELGIHPKKPAPLAKPKGLAAAPKELGSIQLDLTWEEGSVRDARFIEPETLWVTASGMNRDDGLLVSYRFASGKASRTSSLKLEDASSLVLSEAGNLWLTSDHTIGRVEQAKSGKPKFLPIVQGKKKTSLPQWEACAIVGGRVIVAQSYSASRDSKGALLVQSARGEGQPRAFIRASDSGYSVPSTCSAAMDGWAFFWGSTADGEQLWGLDAVGAGPPKLAWKLPLSMANGTVFNHLMALPGRRQLAVGSTAAHGVVLVDPFPEGRVASEHYAGLKVVAWDARAERLSMILEDENRGLTLGGLRWTVQGPVEELPRVPLEGFKARPDALIARPDELWILEGRSIRRLA